MSVYIKKDDWGCYSVIDENGSCLYYSNSIEDAKEWVRRELWISA